MTAMYDWNVQSTPPTKPRLVDETLRDGLQSVSVRDPRLEIKLHLLHRMVRLGIDCVALGYPSSRKRQYDHVLGLAREIAKYRLPVLPCAIARTLVADIEPICQIAEKAGIPIQVGMFVGSSPIRHEVEGWKLDDLLRRSEQAVTFAVRRGLPVLFVTEDTTRSEPTAIKRLYTTAVRAGARQVCIADTVGHSTPLGAANIVRYVRAVLNACDPSVGIDWHGHGDRGLALACSLAAWEAGAERCHGTVLGVGERTGNTPIELLLVNLALSGWRELDLSQLPDYVAAAARALGISVAPHQPVVGRDAFRTAAGVHAAAIAKAKARSSVELADRVYSSVPAALVGRKQSVDVGPSSGRANVELWFAERGMSCTADAVDAVLAFAKRSDHVLSEREVFDAIRSRAEPADTAANDAAASDPTPSGTFALPVGLKWAG